MHTKRRTTTEKKDTKAKYSPFVDKTKGLLKILEKRKTQKAQKTESENLELKYERERQCLKKCTKSKGRYICGRYSSDRFSN